MGAGGPQARVNKVVQACCQGQAIGRCRVSLRAEAASRTGTQTRVRRMVAVVALASRVPLRLAAARVRLNAITASTSQAAFAPNRPLGRCARAEFFRSAWTCSTMAWPRWVLSAATVSWVSGSVVVKKAWNRQVSNSSSWLVGFSSGIRRTTNRPGTCWAAGREALAVNVVSATSAREIHRPLGSSNTASR